MERYLGQLGELADQLGRGRAKGSDFVHDPGRLRVHCARVLEATDEYLTSIGADLDQREPLLWLMKALEDAAEGIENKLTKPNKPDNRTPIPRAIREIRGELSAVMDFLWQKGLSRKEAASYVLRRIDPPTLAALRHQGSLANVDWKTIERWRQDAAKEDSETPDREGFLGMKERIEEHANQYSRDELSSGLLTYVARRVQDLKPTSD